jgi:hypothetical protein
MNMTLQDESVGLCECGTALMIQPAFRDACGYVVCWKCRKRWCAACGKPAADHRDPWTLAHVIDNA